MIVKLLESQNNKINHKDTVKTGPIIRVQWTFDFLSLSSFKNWQNAVRTDSALCMQPGSHDRLTRD